MNYYEIGPSVREAADELAFRVDMNRYIEQGKDLDKIRGDVVRTLRGLQEIECDLIDLVASIDVFLVQGSSNDIEPGQSEG